MGHIEQYRQFTSALYGFERKKSSLYTDYRFLAGYLIFSGSAESGKPRFLKKLSLLLLRFCFNIESTSHCIIRNIPYFPHPKNIINGARYIGANVVIYHNATLGAKRIDYQFNPSSRPRINDDVVLATGCVVLGGGEVAAGGIVKANEVRVTDK